LSRGEDAQKASIIAVLAFCVSPQETVNYSLSEWEVLIMLAQVNYKTETKVVPFGDRTIRIVNHTPILPPKEKERRKKEIEQRLFDVFSKYADTQK
jgi:hypothetical protein